MIRHPQATGPPPRPRQQSSGPPKKRGSYNCGRCGLPKKGHNCHMDPTTPSPDTVDPTPPTPLPPPPRSDHRLRRALSFDDEGVGETGESVEPETKMEGEDEEDDEVDVGGGARVPAWLLAEALKRLPPRELMVAAAVCTGWRDCVRRVWISAEEVRLRVTPQSPIGFAGAVFNKCSSLSRLALTMESDADGTVLASIAFSCPNLVELEIKVANNAVNRITEDDLARFLSEKRSLTVLKIEGCTNFGCLNICSSSLLTLWLSDMYCISKTIINCPNLKELSLDFTRQENDSTDLVAMMDCLGRTCPRLRNIHIASIRLCNEGVLALAGANLRYLRMLSLILGSKITDASVAAIVSSCVNLELLDLSGSSISDSGIGMICNAFPHTLSRLLLALCPNITASGIQFAAAQLPYLQLIDCGMSICQLDSENDNLEEIISHNKEGSEGTRCHKSPNVNPLPMYQKLIIKHECLKKLSLWGCSSLDALYLNCPKLNDLNLSSCTNLNPQRLLIQCPNLTNVHASGCHDMLIGAIRNQVLNEFAAVENQFQCKRSADGSKRVQVPYFLSQQASDGAKRKRMRLTPCNVHLDR